LFHSSVSAEIPWKPLWSRRCLIVANEFLESEVCELRQAVSQAYARGRFKPYNG
jgi:hypothetical protein